MAYEDDVSISAIDRLYEEAGVILPGMTLKNIKEVQTFHKSVVHNRQMHLSNEVKRYQDLVLNRDQVVQSLATRRAEVMRILRSHGALDQYLKLNEDIAKAEGELKFLKEKLSTAESLELGNTSLEKDRLLLKERMQIDLKEREEIVKQASVSFSKYTSLLYEHPGTLSIDATDNGPSFKTRIDGARGKGIKNMVIFCFDMMIMEIMHSRGMGPGFLIHDSHLFDGVDDRQVAKALIAGAQASEEFGFQYIVTFNSNDLPRSELGDFPIDKYILPVKLTDAEETGGLFGLRF
ncbi:MAG: DUF2326 domain-containing protein [Micavibrio aeruginosavorus]|uniref:DUF2326 domain-containing protein n=1 Tax=Micavibrio aeruginosavorus TaxID=349221 RepID=A0A7T5UIM9_9BACT|nr:MAG: DUF2326 domain-containing protein [Micavibrio aeruginosavorus]